MVCGLLRHVVAEQLLYQNSEDSMHSGMVCDNPVCDAQVQLAFRKLCHSIHSGMHYGTALHVVGEERDYQRRQNTHHTGTADYLA